LTGGLFDELDEWWLLQKLPEFSTKALTVADVQLELVVEKLNLGAAICFSISVDLSEGQGDGTGDILSVR
jgi:hypothetical protein